MADDSKDGQQQFNWARAEQLRLLRDCQLPKDVKDKAGKGVSPIVLKAVLTAIDQHGRGRVGGCFASVSTLAKAANIGKRTCTRAIKLLHAQGLVCLTNDGPRYGVLGSPTNRYTIVWSELAVLVDSGPIFRADQSATGADQSATGDIPERHGGAQNVTSNVQETSVKRRLNVHDGTRRDGAKEFNEEELAAVRLKANTIDKWIAAKEPDDRELVLKVATLWHDGEIPEDAVQQVLESFERKQEAGERIDNACSWLWGTLRGQLYKHGLRLEPLLARTRWPAELLAPRERSTAKT